MIISNIIWFVGIILLGETCTRKTCLNLGSLLEQERKDFEKAIEENKWFLSEKEGYDIGRQKAEKDFTQKHFKDWAEKDIILLDWFSGTTFVWVAKKSIP